MLIILRVFIIRYLKGLVKIKYSQPKNKSYYKERDMCNMCRDIEDTVVFSDLAMSLDEQYDDEVLSGVVDIDRFVQLDDWLKIDDVDYRKY